MNARAIFAYTRTGNTPRMLSSFTPGCPIYAVTTDEKTYRQLALSWGVYPILLPETESIDELLVEAVTKAKENDEIHNGDDIVIAGGANVIPSIGEPYTMNRVIGGVLKV